MKQRCWDLSAFKYLDISDGRSRVYRIIDNLTNTVIYVGCTKCSVYKRLSFHVYESLSYCSNKKKGELMTKCLKNNSLFVEVLYVFDDRRTAEIVEKYLINYISKNSLSHDLFNTIAVNNVTDKTFYKNINKKNGTIKKITHNE